MSTPAANQRSRYLFPKAYADRVQRFRVACGFLLLIAFGLLSHPTLRSLGAGLPICFAGLALRAWAAGHLAKDRVLAVSGPYRFMRNPLYGGTLIAAAGIFAASRSVLLAIIFAAVFVLVYLPAIELEEQHLGGIFSEYEAYASQVNRFVPTRAAPSSTRAFSWVLYRRNEEYKALLGFVIAVGWLLFRALSHA